MKRMRTIWAIVCVLLTGASAGFAKDVVPEDLVYMCEDIPPSNYLDNGQLKGISIEILNLIWKKLEVKPQPIKVVPWARGYHLVQTEKNHVLFSMTRNQERETLFKWVGPIFTVKSVLMGRADSKIKIETLEDAMKYRIGTIKDDVVEKYLLAKNFDPKKVESVSTLEQNFEKLRLGRVDFITHTEETLRNFIKEKKYEPNEFMVFFILSENVNYYAFNKEVPDELIRKFQNALDSLKKERDDILTRYEITP